MKKSSKNVMKIVALLLCLVLATSSIVSTTLAKFVVTKDATTSIKFDTFGLQIDVDTKLSQTGIVQKGDSATITYNSLSMRPGATEDNVLRFYLTKNQPNVPVNLVVKVEVDTHDDCYVDETGLVGNSPAAFMPIAFKVGTVDSLTATTWTQKGKTDAFISASNCENLNTAIENALATQIATAMGGTSSGNTVTKAFDRANGTGAVPAVTFADSKLGISFGFEWPLNAGNVTNNDLIETYIANRLDGTAPITITYTVSFEQKGA